MGYMRHHTIVVTSSMSTLIRLAHKRAIDLLGELVSPIILGVVNGYESFFVAPDGSKEGWQESIDADTSRDKLIKYIEEQKYEDGSSSIKYVEVYFGDDEKNCEILKHN